MRLVTKLLISLTLLSLSLFSSNITKLYASDVYHSSTIEMPNDSQPIGVIVDSQNHRAYVVGIFPDLLVMIDTQNDVILAIESLSFSPVVKQPVVSTLRKEVYIGESGTNKLAVFDANTLALKQEITLSGNPSASSINEATDQLYVTINFQWGAPGLVDVIELSTKTVTKSYTVGFYPNGIAVNPDTDRIYVSSEVNSPGLTILDGTTGTTVSTLNFDNVSNNTVAIDRTLNRIYVVNLFEAAIFSIDGNTNTVLDKIPLTIKGYFSYPMGLAIDPLLHQAYIGTSNEHQRIFVVDTTTNTKTQDIKIAPPEPFPWQAFYYLDLDTGLHKVYAPNRYGKTIEILELIDTEGPVVTINSPAGQVTSNTVPIDVTIVDGSSGVASYSYELDSLDIPNTQTSIDLTYLLAGEHAFFVTALDNAGNSTLVGSVFTYSPTPAALKAVVDQMYLDSEITKLGSSIYNKIEQAQTYVALEDYDSASLILNALINQIEAQIGKHITKNAGNILLTNINYLIATFL